MSQRAADETMLPTMTIVVPCYNEEAVLAETVSRLLALLERLEAAAQLATGSNVLLVDDGSRDRTWELIREHHARDARIRGLKLSANRGHQIALVAGLFAADADVIVSIDADLQDDVDAIEGMLASYREGHEVVYGVRRLRTVDSFFKRSTAEGYYKLLHLMGAKVVFNHADYRLLSRRAVAALKEYSEVNLFIRGLVPLIGFKSNSVYYDRGERFAGESKYPLKKMLMLAWDGVTSFSSTPLRLVSLLGIFVSLVSVAMIFWTLWVKLFTTRALPGWASSVIPIYLLGGIQLLSIGVVGEYVAKVYFETKRRPRYFIEEQL
jgi:glycosyltransferase involved in cell wall biosynthesis